jgi:hypothetical protein
MLAKQDREGRRQAGAHDPQGKASRSPATGIGADLLRGTLRYDEKSGNWYLDSVNVMPYLARYRDQEVMIVLAPLGTLPVREAPRLECEICGCALDELGDCPRCQLHFVQTARRRQERVRKERLFSEIDRIVRERWRD